MNQLVTIEDSVYGSLAEASKVNQFGSMAILDAEKHFAIQHLYKNQKAVEVAQNNPVSVHNAMVNLAAIGISLNPATSYAYLVPRDGAICLDISYMGLMHLAQDLGSIQWAQAKIVHENDTYENQGLKKEPIHKYNAFSDRGKKVGVYCTAKLVNGDFMTQEMSEAEILEVKKTSKSAMSKYSPWNTFEDEMWRKTVVKRASKYWPKPVGQNRFNEAVRVINEHEGLDQDPEKDKELIEKLNKYNSDEHTALELYGFTESVRAKSESKHQWLCSQFESGKKSSGCKKISEGRSAYFDYLNIFKGDDDLAKDEAREEMTDLELKIVEASL